MTQTRTRSALEAAPPQPADQADECGDVVVTWDEDRTRILAVTRQDEDGRVLKIIALVPPGPPAEQTDEQMQSLERVEYFLKAWEWGGVGQSVAQVSDSPDSYVVLTISDLRIALALARAQGEQSAPGAQEGA